MIRHKNGNNAMAAQTEFHLRALVLAGHAHAGMHRARCATLSISLSLSLSLSLFLLPLSEGGLTNEEREGVYLLVSPLFYNIVF